MKYLRVLYMEVVSQFSVNSALLLDKGSIIHSINVQKKGFGIRLAKVLQLTSCVTLSKFFGLSEP